METDLRPGFLPMADFGRSEVRHKPSIVPPRRSSQIPEGCHENAGIFPTVPSQRDH